RNCSVPADFTQLKTPRRRLPAKHAPVFVQEVTDRAFLIPGGHAMHRFNLLLSLTIILVATVLGLGTQNRADRLTKPCQNFELDVIVDGRPLDEYSSRGRTYVEALQGAEYE